MLALVITLIPYEGCCLTSWKQNYRKSGNVRVWRDGSSPGLTCMQMIVCELPGLYAYMIQGS